MTSVDDIFLFSEADTVENDSTILYIGKFGALTKCSRGNVILPRRRPSGLLIFCFFCRGFGYARAKLRNLHRDSFVTAAPAGDGRAPNMAQRTFSRVLCCFLQQIIGVFHLAPPNATRIMSQNWDDGLNSELFSPSSVFVCIIVHLFIQFHLCSLRPFFMRPFEPNDSEERSAMPSGVFISLWLKR